MSKLFQKRLRKHNNGLLLSKAIGLYSFSHGFSCVLFEDVYPTKHNHKKYSKRLIINNV